MARPGDTILVQPAPYGRLRLLIPGIDTGTRRHGSTQPEAVTLEMGACPVEVKRSDGSSASRLVPRFRMRRLPPGGDCVWAIWGNTTMGAFQLVVGSDGSEYGACVERTTVHFAPLPACADPDLTLRQLLQGTPQDGHIALPLHKLMLWASSWQWGPFEQHVAYAEVVIGDIERTQDGYAVTVMTRWPWPLDSYTFILKDGKWYHPFLWRHRVSVLVFAMLLVVWARKVVRAWRHGNGVAAETSIG